MVQTKVISKTRKYDRMLKKIKLCGRWIVSLGDDGQVERDVVAETYRTP